MCCYEFLVFLKLFSDNAISAPAAALFVQYIVAHDELKYFYIDGVYLIIIGIQPLMLFFSFACASFRMPRVVAAEAV